MKLKRCALTFFVVALSLSAAFAGGAKETGGKPLGDNINKTGLPILKEKETFTIAVLQNSALKSAKDRDCVKKAEEETNIHIEWVEIPNSAWEEKINIMASTGTLPDAVIGEAKLSRNYELFLPLDELLTEYAPVVSQRIANREDYQKALKSPDGKIHALPNGDESTHIAIPTHYWINKAWLDKLGLDMPATVEEFKEALAAFKTQDPNGNGLQDEIPFAFEKAWNWSTSIRNFIGAFGVAEFSEHVFMDGDTVVMAALQPGYYEALKYLSGLYKEGLINQDVFTVSSDQFLSLSGGKEIIGAFAGYRNTNALGMPNATDFVALPILSSSVSEGVTGAYMPTRIGGFAINANCKNPAALVRWYEYLNSDLGRAMEWGRGERGFIWDILEDNEGQHPEFLFVSPEQYKEKGYRSAAEYRNAQSFAGNTPAVWWKDYDMDIRYVGPWTKDLKLEAVKRDLPRAIYGLPAGMAPEENADRRSILLVDINNYLEKFVADSVINGIDETKWNKHLETMKALKVDEYVALCQEFVNGLEE